jgi:sulfite exporter TauE/SafE
MAVFWLGTLPAMVSLGVGLQKLTGVLRPRLPVITSSLVIAAGLYMVIARLSLPALALPQTPAGEQNPPPPIERVNNLDEQEMPCCHDR